LDALSTGVIAMMVSIRRSGRFGRRRRRLAPPSRTWSTACLSSPMS